jgi:hypothetical protein
MISEFKRRVSREIYGNQNYLNFIKKNHQLMYASPHTARRSSPAIACPRTTAAPSP